MSPQNDSRRVLIGVGIETTKLGANCRVQVVQQVARQAPVGGIEPVQLVNAVQDDGRSVSEPPPGAEVYDSVPRGPRRQDSRRSTRSATKILGRRFG